MEIPLVRKSAGLSLDGVNDHMFGGNESTISVILLAMNGLVLLCLQIQ